jgi:trimethylamine--corrinoid protein Co-methyltransferase
MISRHAGNNSTIATPASWEPQRLRFSKTTGPGPKVASNSSASSAVDAQAAYESQMSIWSSAMAHANLVYHGARWMEGGLTASFEKIVLDVEMLQMMAETIASVPSGGHFFGAAHTLERCETAFYPLLSDWRAYEASQIDGAKDATQRATAIWQQALERYEPPLIDPATQEALEAHVAKRKDVLRDIDH